jgi:hypothetical protein
VRIILSLLLAFQLLAPGNLRLRNNMSYRHSTSNSGSGTTFTVNVPTGVASGDIVILVCTYDGGGYALTGLWPEGFTQFYDDYISAPDLQTCGIAWKRLTGSDTGTYNMGTIGAARVWNMHAIAFSGRSTGSDPEATHNIHATGETSPITSTALGVTAVAEDDLVFINCPDKATHLGVVWTQPTGFTVAQELSLGYSASESAYKENVSAGATGNITSSFTIPSGTSGWASYLIRIPKASSGPSIAALMASHRRRRIQ